MFVDAELLNVDNEFITNLEKIPQEKAMKNKILLSSEKTLFKTLGT